MGGGGGSDDNEELRAEQREISQRGLELEQERLALFKKSQEAFQQQLSLLKQQQKSRNKLAESKLKLLSEQQGANVEQFEDYKKTLAEIQKITSEQTSFLRDQRQTAQQQEQEAQARADTEAGRAGSARQRLNTQQVERIAERRQQRDDLSLVTNPNEDVRIPTRAPAQNAPAPDPPSLNSDRPDENIIEPPPEPAPASPNLDSSELENLKRLASEGGDGRTVENGMLLNDEGLNPFEVNQRRNEKRREARGDQPNLDANGNPQPFGADFGNKTVFGRNPLAPNVTANREKSLLSDEGKVKVAPQERTNETKLDTRGVTNTKAVTSLLDDDGSIKTNVNGTQRATTKLKANPENRKVMSLLNDDGSIKSNVNGTQTTKKPTKKARSLMSLLRN